MFETKEVALLYAPSDSLNKVGFVEMCEMWRKRVTNENVLADVFDGNIWKEWTVSTVPNGQEAIFDHINAYTLPSLLHDQKFSVILLSTTG